LLLRRTAERDERTQRRAAATIGRRAAGAAFPINKL
jgi:hypothetical protein